MSIMAAIAYMASAQAPVGAAVYTEPSPVEGVVYASNYGAVGDGTTDNTIAINAAIAAAVSGQVVQLGSGTFMIKSAYLIGASYQPKGILLKSGVTLKGAGKTLTTIKLSAPPAGSYCTVNNDASTNTNTVFDHIMRGAVTGATVSDLTIDGNIAQQINYNPNPYYNIQSGLPNETDAICFDGGSNNKVHRVNILSAAGFGVAFGTYYGTSPYGELLDCYMEKCINGGVVWQAGSNFGYSKGCRHYDHSCDPVRVRANNCTIEDDEASHTRQNVGPQQNFAGYYVEGGKNIVFRRCYSHNHSAFGFDIWQAGDYGGAIPQNATEGTLIEDCRSEYNGNGGVRVVQRYVKVKSCTIKNNARTESGFIDNTIINRYGVGIGSNTESNLIGIVIDDNDIIENRGTNYQQWAVSAEGAFSGLTITNNRVVGSNGVYDSAKLNPSSSTITGNTFTA